MDVAVARKRTRRKSSASIVSAKSQGLEDHTNEESRAVSSMLLAEQRVRKRTVSRVSAREFPTTAGSGSHPPLSGTAIASKSNRPRTMSMVSSTSGKGTVPTVILWQSYTQKTLEKVLQSRLVETLITVSVPSSVEQSVPPVKPSTPAPRSSRGRQPSPRASPTLKSKHHSPQNSSSRSSLGSREELPAKRVSRTGTTTSPDSLAPTLASQTRRSVTSTTKLNGSASKSAALASSQVKADPEARNVPNFISGIHRPSTNPDFPLDLNDFSKWTDLSATHMTVHLWARLPPDSPSVLGHDKGKEKMSNDVDISDPQWRIAGKWDLCLADLVLMPDEVSSSQFQQDLFKKQPTADVSTTV